METIQKTYFVTSTAKIYTLRKDVAIVNCKSICNEKILSNDFFFYNPVNITDGFDPIDVEKDDNYQRIAVMKKGFLDAYSKTGFGLKEYNSLSFLYEYEPQTLFEALENNSISIDDIEIVEASYYDEKYYPFIYGKTRQGWLPHMEPYNRHCYMITDFDYDLEKVEKYLLEKEKDGTVLIKKTIRKVHDEEKIVVIQDIPYYNKDNESGERFIDFYCLVNDKENLQEDFFGNIPTIYKELEQFKLKKG